MNWFLIALITPLSLAFVNHFDKHLISRYTKDSSIGVLILFSSLFAVFALPVLVFFDSDLLSSISLPKAIVLVINGGLMMVSILFYLYALENDETSYVAPLLELIPLFSLILGYIFLREVLTVDQLWPAALIVSGSIFLSLEFNGKRAKFKWKLIVLMVLCSLFYALNAVIFKYIAINQEFIDSLFWDLSGKVIFGIILFLAIKKYRTNFLKLITSQHYKVIGLNLVNEAIGLIGIIAGIYALLLAPVVLVQTVGSMQTAFVFIFGIIFTVFFPRFVSESLKFTHMIQKTIGVIIITIGVYYLNV